MIIIHLKRFKSGNSIFKSKLTTLVDFPITNFDLSKYVQTSVLPDDEKNKETSLIYDLFAVSNHFGGLGGGHYTAFIKNS